MSDYGVPGLPGDGGNDRVYTVSDRGNQYGPYSKNELAGMRAVGQLSAESLVFAEGWDQWFPIASVIAMPATAAAGPTTQMAIQADYVQANVENTYNVQNVYHQTTTSNVYSVSRRRERSQGSMKAVGVTLVLVGLFGACVFPLLMVLIPVGVVFFVIGMFGE